MDDKDITQHERGMGLKFGLFAGSGGSTRLLAVLCIIAR